MKLVYLLIVFLAVTVSILHSQTVADYRMKLYAPFIIRGGITFPQIYLGPYTDRPWPVMYKLNNGNIQIKSIAEINTFLKAKFPAESDETFFSTWLPSFFVLCLSEHDSKVIRKSDSELYGHGGRTSELFEKYGTVDTVSADKGFILDFNVWVCNGSVDQWSVVCKKDPPRIVSVDVFSKEKPASYPDALLTKWEKNQKKLSEIILPEIYIKNVDVKDALSLLETKSRELDPAKVGIHIYLDTTNHSKSYPININARGISLRDLCTIIANQNGIQFQTEDDGIHFCPLATQ